MLATAAPAAANTSSRDIVVFMDNFSQDGVQEGPGNSFASMSGAADFRPQWDASAPVTSAFLALIVPITGIDQTRNAEILSGDSNWTLAGKSFTTTEATYIFNLSGSVTPDAIAPLLKYRIYGNGIATSDAFPKNVVDTLNGPQFVSAVTKNVIFGE